MDKSSKSDMLWIDFLCRDLGLFSVIVSGRRKREQRTNLSFLDGWLNVEIYHGIPTAYLAL